MAPRARRLTCAALTACALWACGYRFTAGAGKLPGGARTLSVPVLANETPEPDASAVFTAALRDELARVGREGGAASDARAEGRITQVAGGPAIATTRLSSDGIVSTRVSTFRIQATVVVRVVRGSERLAELTVSGGEDYLAGGSILEAEANRRGALQRLAATLMRQAVEGLLVDD